MSIHRNMGLEVSLTETRRALRHFTDRRGSIKRFASYLNDEPAQQKIFVIHGDGGNGKTLLLRFLRESCCKRLAAENWEYVNSLEGDEFVENFVGAIGSDQVPSALVDFALEPRGEYRPKEAFSALVKMRRDLSGTGLRFPLYDFACVLYLHKTGRLTPERLSELFPQEEIDFAREAVDIIKELPGLGLAKAVLGLFNKHLRERFTVYRKGRSLDEEMVEQLRAMDPESDLYGMFPALFAADLSTAMTIPGAPDRVVLFFDTHEAFWEVTERRFSDEKYFMEDEWLRRLLGNLELGRGIVAVVAGREVPRWAEASRETIPTDHIDSYLLGGLSSADAGIFLQKVGINDEEMVTSLKAYSEIRPDEVHPLFLGLCADIVLAARDSGQYITPAEFREIPGLALKAKELMNRLRKYVDRPTEFAINALSACRSFDRDLYVRLMKGLNLNFSNESFDYLTEFSIVWESTDRRQGWYRIHDLIRRLAEEQKDTTTTEAHRFLSDYYKELGAQGNVAAIAEAIYHLNRLDVDASVQQWAEALQQALDRTRYDVCRTLLAIRNELVVKDNFDRALLSSFEGDYYAALYQHTNAVIEYSEAIDSYDDELAINPDSERIQNNKGITLAHLGEVQAALSQHKEAIESYQQAISACDAGLRLDPDMAMTQNNKGLALIRLGEVQAVLSQHEEALESYQQAISACEAALRLEPDMAITQNNKGLTFMRVGEVQAALSHHKEAIASYQQAIFACDAALLLAPELAMAHSNKGSAWMRMGESQAALSQHMEAIASYQQGTRACDSALLLAPDMVMVQCNKGSALVRLGDSHAELSQLEEAIESYQQSVFACDAALRLAPDFVMAHNSKGVALLGLGRVQAAGAQPEEAIRSYQQAIVSCDAALRLAADMPMVHSNKGTALLGCARVQESLSQHGNAIESCRLAISAFEAALHFAPDFVVAHNNKGVTLMVMGDAEATLTKRKITTEIVRQAIAEFSKSLEIAPSQDDIREIRDELERDLAD